MKSPDDAEMRTDNGGEGQIEAEEAADSVPLRERYGGWRVTGLGLLVAIATFFASAVLMRSALSNGLGSLDRQPSFHGGESWFVLGILMVGGPFLILALLLVFVLIIPQSYLTRYRQFRVVRTVAIVMVPQTLVFAVLTGAAGSGMPLAEAVPMAIALALFLDHLNKSLEA